MLVFHFLTTWVVFVTLPTTLRPTGCHGRSMAATRKDLLEQNYTCRNPASHPVSIDSQFPSRATNRVELSCRITPESFKPFHIKSTVGWSAEALEHNPSEMTFP